MLKDKDLIDQFVDHKARSERGLALQHKKARECHLFYAADKSAYTARVADKTSERLVVFSNVKPFVDAVSGMMIQLRRKPQYNARMIDNQKAQSYSEYTTSCSDYFRDNANLAHYESRQDQETLITGYGGIDTGISYEFNPDGDIRAEVLKYDEVFWDPLARDTNLLDARWVFRVKKLRLEDAEEMFDAEEEDFTGDDTGPGESAYQYNPNDGVYNKVAYDSPEDDEGLVDVFYYQYYALKPYYRLRNPAYDLMQAAPQIAIRVVQALMIAAETAGKYGDDETIDDLFTFDPKAEYLVLSQEIYNKVQKALKALGFEGLEYQKHERRCFYTAILTPNKVFKHFKSPDQGGFTLKFKTGFYDAVKQVWFGMVDQLKEPARYANKALTEILYTIAKNSKGGVMYERSAVDKPHLFEQQWAATNSAVMVNDGALSGGKIQPKAQAAQPTGYENIYQLAMGALSQSSGVNPEFMGNSDNKMVSASLEKQRIDQVVTTLANYFDGISLFQKEHARMMLTFIRMLAENSQGRLVAILGDQGAKTFQELSLDKLMVEYDVEISEVPETAQQKSQTFDLMMNMAEKLAGFGVNIYPVVIDYAPISGADKAKLKQLVQPPQSPPDPEVAQIQKDLQKSLIASQQADAQDKLASAQLKGVQMNEKMANIQKIQHETEQIGLENQELIDNPPQKSQLSISA